MKGFATFAASIGVAVVIAAMLHALRSAASPESALHAVGHYGFHATVTLALALIVTPPAGSLLTLSVAEGFRRTTGPRTLLRVFVALRGLYWLAAVASLWFPVHAHRSLGWPAARIAWVYGALLGVILGALATLATITRDLRGRIAAADAWRTP